MSKLYSIHERLLENVALLNNIFGSNSHLILHDQEVEQAKRHLVQIFGYKTEDVQRLFPALLNEKQVDKTMSTIFTFTPDKKEGGLFGGQSNNE